MFGEISVGRLQDIGNGYQVGPADKLVDQPTKLTVVEKPEDWNPAHAVIPEKITRGLANKILPALVRHSPPASA
jgi:hypothetical protein